MDTAFFEYIAGEGPIISMAIHNGHAVRDEIRDRLALTEVQRLREEDPFTDLIAQAAPARFIAQRSRFEIDLNRPREEAIYLEPEHAWGLHVWKEPLPPEVIGRSLAQYDDFYAVVDAVISRNIQKYGHVVVLDVHTYNHRRASPDAPPEDPQINPEVNLGTGTMQRDRWAYLVDGFLDDLRNYDFLGRHLDVRENVKFYGGHLCRWLHERYPASVCALAIEFKKFFMDEWSGEPDATRLKAIQAGLASTVPGLLERLDSLRAPVGGDSRYG